MLVEKTLGGLHAFLEQVLVRNCPADIPSMLDLGCGSGAWLKRLQGTVVGAKVGIDYVQPATVAGLDLRGFDLNVDSPSALGQYSLVTCIEVIEHIENVGRLLDVISIATLPDGVALITTPNIESLRGRVRALVAGKIPSFDEKSDPTHLMPILRDSLEKMLNRRGMAIVETLQYPPNRTVSLQYRRSVLWATKILGLVLPDQFYGDTAVHIVKRVGAT